VTRNEPIVKLRKTPSQARSAWTVDVILQAAAQVLEGGGEDVLTTKTVAEREDTAKQIRQVLLLLQEGGFKMPTILTSVDRYGSVMLAEYTAVSGKKDHWDCEILAERMKSELFEPPINMLFVDARGEAARMCSMLRGSGELCIDQIMDKRRQIGERATRGRGQVRLRSRYPHDRSACSNFRV
jgi:hypothetical protein